MTAMQTAETLSRALAEARKIEETGRFTDPHVIGIHGYVGGRESNPTEWWAHAVSYTSTDHGTCVKFWSDDQVRDVIRCAYVIDGTAYYVAGWQGDGGTPNLKADGYVVLHPVTDDVLLMPKRTYFLRTDVIPSLNGAAY